METAPDLPGLNARRLLGLMRGSIERCALDLSGYVVLTEAASGAYLVTPVLAALAGAEHVYAVTRSSRHGSIEEITSKTKRLAALAGVSARIEVMEEKAPEVVSRADIITNSGHVRPIDRKMAELIKPTAVIPLMYEAWELREGDVDISACRERGIRLVGTNERHPSVAVFSFLGVMAVKLLLDAGVSVFSSNVLVVCDNPFGPYLEAGLTAGGAEVRHCRAIAQADMGASFDAIFVATTPTAQFALSPADVDRIHRFWPGAVIAIFWGDVDRTVLDAAGLNYWPSHAPHRGHMGILPSGVGPEAVVRLQAGSLKAAESVLRYASNPGHPAHAFAQAL